MNDNNSPLVSVIVPVYNSKLYLRRCLDSILNQTYLNFELIIVNDGSTDSSKDILRKYANLDDRIVIINQNNMGRAVARNTGIENVTGDYIMFVDSDDYVGPNFISDAVKAIVEDTDIVCFGMTIKTEHEDKQYISIQENKSLTKEEAMRLLINDNYLWNKMYRKSLFDNVKFPVGKDYEDVYINWKLFHIARTVINLSISSNYFYVVRKDSVVNHPTPTSIIDSFEASYEQYKAYQNYYPKLNNEILDNIIGKAISYVTYREYGLRPDLDDKVRQILKDNNIPKDFDLIHRLSMMIFKVSEPSANFLFKLRKLFKRSI